MAEERVDRRLAAIFAGDIAGYSRLMGVDEEGTLRWTGDQEGILQVQFSVLEASITSTRRTIHERSNKSKPRNERNPPPPILRSWRVIIMRSKGEHLGSVEAADRERAEAVAMNQTRPARPDADPGAILTVGAVR
jgi:hypothetical protein